MLFRGAFAACLELISEPSFFLVLLAFLIYLLWVVLLSPHHFWAVLLWVTLHSHPSLLVVLLGVVPWCCFIVHSLGWCCSLCSFFGMVLLFSLPFPDLSFAWCCVPLPPCGGVPVTSMKLNLTVQGNKTGECTTTHKGRGEKPAPPKRTRGENSPNPEEVKGQQPHPHVFGEQKMANKRTSPENEVDPDVAQFRSIWSVFYATFFTMFAVCENWITPRAGVETMGEFKHSTLKLQSVKL